MQKRSNPVRAFIAGVLLFCGALLVPVTIVATWLHTSILNTDNFVALYAPVAGKTSFQDSVANQIANVAAESVDNSSVLNSVQSMSSSVTGSVDSFLADVGIDSNLSGRTEDWVGQLVDSVHDTVFQHALPAVQSPQFSGAWTESLRQVHSQILNGLEAGTPTILSLEAGPYVELLQQSLIDQGYVVAELIPPAASNASVPLAELQLNEKWSSVYWALVDYGSYLPWINVAILLLGVLVANRHMRALAGTSFAVAALSGALWWGAPLVGQQVVVDIGAANSGQSAADILWQTGIAPLQTTSAVVAVSAVGVGLLSFAFHLATRKRR